MFYPNDISAYRNEYKTYRTCKQVNTEESHAHHYNIYITTRQKLLVKLQNSNINI